MKHDKNKHLLLQNDNKSITILPGKLDSVVLEREEYSEIVRSKIGPDNEVTFHRYNLYIQLNGVLHDLGETLSDLVSKDIMIKGFYVDLSRISLLVSKFLEEITSDYSYSNIYKETGILKINSSYLREFLWKCLSDALKSSKLCPLSLFEEKSLEDIMYKTFNVPDLNLSIEACYDKKILLRSLNFNTDLEVKSFEDIWYRYIYNEVKGEDNDKYRGSLRYYRD